MDGAALAQQIRSKYKIAAIEHNHKATTIRDRVGRSGLESNIASISIDDSIRYSSVRRGIYEIELSHRREQGRRYDDD